MVSVGGVVEKVEGALTLYSHGRIRIELGGLVKQVLYALIIFLAVDFVAVVIVQR